MAFADSADGIEPSDQSLALTRRCSPRLRRPGALVDQLDRRAAKLLSQFLALALKCFKRNAGPSIEFIVELPPCPRGCNIARRLASAVDAGAITDRASPGRRGSLEFREQGAAQIEVGLLALELQ